MASINRFSRTPAPLVINPLSVEELSLVPMAKAQAEAEGLAAINRINTEYDVDLKDLPTIKGMVNTVDKKKSDIVSGIMENGVTTNTVEDVWSLRKDRDKLYKETINKAQENKARIEAFNANVDKMIINGLSPQYGALIKKRGYDKWKGTIGEDGNLNQFKEDYGPKYINVDKDIQQVLSQVKMTLEKDGYTTSDFKFDIDETTGMVKVTQPKESKKYSNIDQLESAINMLYQDYNTPGTERGDFAAYSGLDSETLMGKLNQYKDLYTQRDIQVKGGQSSISQLDGYGGGNPPQDLLDFKNSVRVEAPTVADNLTSSNKTVGTAITAITSSFDAASSLKNMALSLYGGIYGAGYAAYKVGKEMSKDVNEFRSGFEENKKAVYDLSSKSNMDYYLVEKGKLDQKTVEDARRGVPDAIEKVTEASMDWYDHSNTKIYTPTFNAADVVKVNLADNITGRNPGEAAKNLGQRLISTNAAMFDSDGNKISDTKRKEIAEKLMNGDGRLSGQLPPGSPFVAAGENTKFDVDKSQALVVTTDNGETYLMQNQWAKNKNETVYNNVAKTEAQLNALPIGASLPVTITATDRNGQPVTGKVSVRRSYRDENSTGWELISSKGEIKEIDIGDLFRPGVQIGE